MAMSMAFLIDAFFMIRGTYHRVVKSMYMSKRRKYLHFAGRLLTFIGIYVWPFFHPSFSWFKAFYFAIVPYYIMGFCFALASQFNHLTEKNFEKKSRDWYEHQVLTSHTWGANSLFWFFFTGGLNMQTEHHLFPGVNHWHLREIQPILEKYCNKFGIEYRSSKTVSEAFSKHFDHLQKLMVNEKEKMN
jgi:fatty acid desaturase